MHKKKAGSDEKSKCVITRHSQGSKGDIQNNDDENVFQVCAFKIIDIGLSAKARPKPKQIYQFTDIKEIDVCTSQSSQFKRYCDL